MSDNWMVVIPTDPLTIPTQEQLDAALELLRGYGAEEIELKISDAPEFFHAGSNFEGVYCPFCEADIDNWWGSALDAWSKGDRRNLIVETPCCQRTTSLNDFDYPGLLGFACVGFELMNPARDLEPEERERLEAVLGVPVRVIWQHI